VVGACGVEIAHHGVDIASDTVALADAPGLLADELDQRPPDPLQRLVPTWIALSAPARGAESGLWKSDVAARRRTESGHSRQADRTGIDADCGP
jgi:hypothetical protein